MPGATREAPRRRVPIRLRLRRGDDAPEAEKRRERDGRRRRLGDDVVARRPEMAEDPSDDVALNWSGTNQKSDGVLEVPETRAAGSVSPRFPPKDTADAQARERAARSQRRRGCRRRLKERTAPRANAGQSRRKRPPTKREKTAAGESRDAATRRVRRDRADGVDAPPWAEGRVDAAPPELLLPE